MIRCLSIFILIKIYPLFFYFFEIVMYTYGRFPPYCLFPICMAYNSYN